MKFRKSFGAKQGDMGPVLFWVLVAVLIAGRLVLASCQDVYVWIDGAPLDDELMFRAAQSITAGNWLGAYDYLTLSKQMFFAVWLAFLHLLGVPWIIRMIGTRMNQEKYEGELHIYCHRELAEAIRTITSLVVQKKIRRLFDERILFHILEDGEQREILDSRFTFYDIRSTKAKQFGFLCETETGLRLAFPGDEPCPEHLYPAFRETDWLFHEAFCLYEERERFRPYEKHHSTVRDACRLAEKLSAKHLVLWHTEDKDLARRKKRYLKEGQPCFSGKLYVPEDGEILPLEA